MIRAIQITLACVAVVMASAGQVQAGPIGFATDFGVEFNIPAQSSLYQVDFGTNTATLIGSTGFNNVTGIDFQPGTGTLFGIDHSTDQLIIINTSTGAGTVVGSLGVNLFDVGLAFDAAGNLFTTSNGGLNTNLYSVNVTTGAATLIGSTNTPGVVGLDFSSTGTLFGLVDTSGNQLVTINTSTGAATTVGGLGLSTSTGGIDFDVSRNLYGAFGFVNAGLTTINSNTGTAATPTDLGIDFAGLAIANPIPEPSSLALLTIGAISLFGYRWRRKRKQSA